MSALRGGGKGSVFDKSSHLTKTGIMIASSSESRAGKKDIVVPVSIATEWLVI